MRLFVFVVMFRVFVGGSMRNQTLQRIQCAMIHSISRKGKQTLLPHDLMTQISEYITNDWLLFNEAFHYKKRTQLLLDLSAMLARKPLTGISNVTLGGLKATPYGMDPYIAYQDGRITDISLFGMKLRDEDIADLSKLPPKLEHLNLEYNHLQTFDVTKLPSGLKELLLGVNKLSKINLDGLPPSLTALNLADNELTEVSWTKLPKSLTILGFGGNNLKRIDLRALCPEIPRPLSVYLQRNPKIRIIVDKHRMVQPPYKWYNFLRLAMTSGNGTIEIWADPDAQIDARVGRL